ncbi:MAG: DUF1330 domain-containing protein [Rhodospirillaceae bacterium]|nr:DUF1330 domain-containing protein [Rhodospirillaceae bacterium]
MAAYIVANNHSTEFEANLPAYRARVTQTAQSFGGRYLARGTPVKVLEGQWLARQRNVMSVWPDQAAAERFWFSDAYQKDIRPHRVGSSVNDIAIFTGEGDPSPLPAGDEVYMLVLAQLAGPPDRGSAYAKAVAALVPKFGGRYLVRGGPAKVLEGEWLTRLRVVLTYFPSLQAATDFWFSDAYQKDTKPLRDGTGIYDVGLFAAEK